MGRASAYARLSPLWCSHLTGGGWMPDRAEDYGLGAGEELAIGVASPTAGVRSFAIAQLRGRPTV
jgi:hypothetical protein